VPKYVVRHIAEIFVLFVSDVLAFFVVGMMTLVCVEVKETLVGVMNFVSCGPELVQAVVNRALSTECRSLSVQG
jgi:hypothetical protein